MNPIKALVSPSRVVVVVHRKIEDGEKGWCCHVMEASVTDAGWLDLDGKQRPTRVNYEGTQQFRKSLRGSLENC